MNINDYWQAVLRQDARQMRVFFQADAVINWHCTNECFTVAEFIQANCEYPGQWDGVVERVEQMGNLIITVTRVFSKADELSFHAVSLIQVENDKIAALDEYWGDDGPAPQWRLERHIGKPIHKAYES